MKWLSKLFKNESCNESDNTSAFIDGNALLISLLGNNVNNRRKAVKSLQAHGIASLGGLTPEGLAKAYGHGEMLIMPVDAQESAIIICELLLRLFFCRALLDDDEIVRKTLSNFLSNTANSWTQKQMINLNVKMQKALKDMGLTGPALFSSANSLKSRIKELQVILHSNVLTEKQNCIKCGKPLFDVANLWTMSKNYDFSDAVAHAGAVLSTPGCICKKCKSVICKGCLSVQGSDIICAKCGVGEMTHWSQL